MNSSQTSAISEAIGLITMQQFTPRTSFTLFPHLPTELRMKIWKEACFPRILTLKYESSTDSFDSCPQPTLLSTCRESRQEALRVYMLSFGTSTKAPRIYFNPYLDTLYLPRHGDMGYDESLRDFKSVIRDPTNLLDKLLYVAIDHVNPEIKRPWESYNKATFLRSLPNLEEVNLVMQNETLPLPFSAGNMELQDPAVDPEKLMRIWYYFRQTFLDEERLLEESCKETGREYKAFSLPTVRIKTIVPADHASKSDMEGLESALQRMRP